MEYKITTSCMQQARALSWNGSTCLCSRYSIQMVEAVLATLTWDRLQGLVRTVRGPQHHYLQVQAHKHYKQVCSKKSLFLLCCTSLLRLLCSPGTKQDCYRLFLSGAAYKQEQFLSFDIQNGRVLHVRAICDVTRTTSIL